MNTSSSSIKKECGIYIGGLSLDTSDNDVYKLFSQCGSISFLKLIKPSGDALVRKYHSAYAYITYATSEEAQKAIKKYNFTTLNGAEIRVMHCDKSKVKNNTKANIFVSNLPKGCDNKTLYDTFSIFGPVLSCKVVHNKKGSGPDFGFVQYKDKVAAKKAVYFGNDTMMGKSKIIVKRFFEDNKEKKEKRVTNLFFKNFPLDIEEKVLYEKLAQFGEITSFHLSKKSTGELKGFGFANYKEPEAASNAMDALNGTFSFGESPEPFYIKEAESRQERDEKIRKEIEMLTISGQSYKKNLYVRNIPEKFSTEEILAIFSRYGKIISAVVDKDEISEDNLNYAFICYASPHDASIAVEKGNDIVLDNHKLSVAFFKSKKERLLEKEKELNTVPLIYQGLKPYIKTPKKSTDKKQMGTDLYNLVLSLAPTFSEKYKILGIEKDTEFARKITQMLMEKPQGEVRSMIGLGNVLTQNIQETLSNMDTENKEKEKK